MNYNINYNRILIFDGSYCLHRNLSQPNQWEMINSKGKRTGGIFGTLRTILKELKTYNFYPVVIFDGGLSKRRLDIYPNYKRNLEKQNLLECKWEELTEEEQLDAKFRREYSTQRNDLMEILPLFGIPTIRIDGWEGDDLIYILSKLTKNSIVVSDDKDLIQLINKNNDQECRIRRPLKDEFLDINNLISNNEDINTYIGTKCIIGDPSDNIPSACFQVGEKTAPGLYKLFEVCQRNGRIFPTDEKALDSICKEFNIPKRKAYLNFNVDQFLINYLLTNLKFVDEEVNDEIIYKINETINSTINCEKTYLNELDIILDNLEIKTFDKNGLFNRISALKDVINIKDEDKIQNLKEIYSNGRLF